MKGYQEYLSCRSVSIDTRKIRKDSFFIALKGDNFDGNDFALEALDNGSKYALVSDPKLKETEDCIYVEDTLKHLQDLASHHRDQFEFPVLAITGSNGKTTTKELVHAALSMQYDVGSTEGNLNNHIGVPLTLLSFPLDLDYGIVEMGANHISEIKALCQIAKPDYGFVTNFGKAHLEGFGSLDGVKQGKSELYEYLLQEDRIAFVNIADTEQMERTKELEILSFGFDQEAVFPFYPVKNTEYAGVRYKRTKIQSKLTGNYNVDNIMAATAISLHFGVAIENIKIAIEGYKSNNNRSQILLIGQQMVILDAYNANPSSMHEAVKNLASKTGRKVAVLGDMFELGTYALEEHQKIIREALTNNFKKIYLIGKTFKSIEDQFVRHNVHFYETREAFTVENALIDFDVEWILIKGSRALALEKIVEEEGKKPKEEEAEK